MVVFDFEEKFSFFYAGRGGRGVKIAGDRARFVVDRKRKHSIQNSLCRGRASCGQLLCAARRHGSNDGRKRCATASERRLLRELEAALLCEGEKGRRGGEQSAGEQHLETTGE